MSILNKPLSSSDTNLSLGGSRRLIAAVSLCVGLGISLAQAQEVNEQGWTVLEPSEDSRFVFVSSSTGNDSNSGFSPSRAVKSFDRAMDLMRDNSADWMLLKRGDVWDKQIGTWNLSGRAPDERVVISSYGEGVERPRIEISSGSVITGGVSGDVNNVAIIGIHMVANRPNEESVRGIRWLSTGENLLIEDCKIEGFKDNVTCEALNGTFENFAMRRSVVVDAWSTDGHSQGLFVVRTNGVVLEENVFDHNGWKVDVVDSLPTMFNQNIYIQKGVHGTEFHGNLSSRASAAGIQMRSGGNASENMLYANPLGMRFGYRTLDWPSEYASGSIVDNVVLGGALSDDEMTGSGVGFWIERINGAHVAGNVVSDYVEGSVTWAYQVSGYASNADFIGNVAHNWVSSGGWGQAVKSSARIEGPVAFHDNQWSMDGTNRIMEIWYPEGMEFKNNSIAGFEESADVFSVESSVINYNEWEDRDFVMGDSFSEASFPAAGRNLDSYAQHLGYSDAQAFIEAAREMNRAQWDQRLTGRAAAEWVRAGYIVQD
ncbi:MAG: hypothetical protein P1U42_12460 [Phycisphaerales bacterium]|nr:hypothetical protein [Phycisphaerales bacterium]